MKKIGSEGYFVVPVGSKYALFSFSPYKQMVGILDQLDIPYEFYSDKDDLKRYRNKVKCKQTGIVKYILGDKLKGVPSQFYFTADIIDKVLDFYNIEYKKEVK